MDIPRWLDRMLEGLMPGGGLDVVRYRSPRDMYGKCLLHGRPVGETQICPECKVNEDRSPGYLSEFGVAVKDDE